jgi:hypothetical protein
LPIDLSHRLIKGTGEKGFPAREAPLPRQGQGNLAFPYLSADLLKGKIPGVISFSRSNVTNLKDSFCEKRKTKNEKRHYFSDMTVTGTHSGPGGSFRNFLHSSR